MKALLVFALLATASVANAGLYDEDKTDTIRDNLKEGRGEEAYPRKPVERNLSQVEKFREELHYKDFGLLCLAMGQEEFLKTVERDIIATYGRDKLRIETYVRSMGDANERCLQATYLP
jgi:hypothetical protein